MTLDPAVLAGILGKLEQVKGDPERFGVYEDDPLGFALDILGVPQWDEKNPLVPGLTPDQVALLTAAAENRLTVARSGHGVGKSFALAILVIWWTYARRGLVVTTATTWNQIEKVLWREIASLVLKAKVPLPGEMLQTELRVRPDWYAVGLSTSEPTAFHGRHHARLLVVVDEAPGVSEEIYHAIYSLATGEKNAIVLVGNPTESAGSFYDAFQKGNWKRLHLSCLTHPNVLLGKEVIPGAVTRVWVEESKARYGEHSPIYQSRVLGEFPSTGTQSVCPTPWVDRAMEQSAYQGALKSLTEGKTRILACDVARYGDNRTVLIERRGDVLLEPEMWGGVDTMETTGRIVRAWKRSGADAVVVDEVGLGAGVLDRLLELGVPVVGFHSGKRAATPSLYQNRRAEAWWHMRERLEQGRVFLPQNDALRRDLTSPTYKVRSTGQIAVEMKEEMRRRGVDSPDYADAAIMAFAYDLDPDIFDSATPAAPPPHQDPPYATVLTETWRDGVSDYQGY